MHLSSCVSTCDNIFYSASAHTHQDLTYHFLIPSELCRFYNITYMSSFTTFWGTAKETVLLNVGIRRAFWVVLGLLFPVAPEKLKIFSLGSWLSLFFLSVCWFSSSMMHSSSSHSNLVCTTAWSVLSIHS